MPCELIFVFRLGVGRKLFEVAEIIESAARFGPRLCGEIPENVVLE